MTAYYNENDSHASAWLRELIAAGHIAHGDVDERSIVDVRADDLRGYSQYHFFAGIGGWSYALRLAGWPDERPVWTGSCPCQPFSAAGKRQGTSDKRHLWPEFRRLIAECNPATVFGEQVASRLGREWLAGVRADLEALGYGVGAADLCAAGVGAPHIRQRLYWMADAERRAAERHGHEMAATPSRIEGEAHQRQWLRHDARDGGDAIGMADADGRIASDRGLQRSGQHGQQPQDGGAGWMADAQHAERRQIGFAREDGRDGQDAGRQEAHGIVGARGEIRRMGNPNEQGSQGCGEHAGEHADQRVAWASGVSIACLDGKSRRSEPGIFPLVDGLPRGVVPSGDPGEARYANATAEARTMRLRGYGNAIVPQVAAQFIRCALEADPAALKQRGET